MIMRTIEFNGENGLMGSSKALVYAHNFLMVFPVGVLMGLVFQ